MEAVSPGEVVRVSHVFICRSLPGGRARVTDGHTPAAAAEGAIARDHGLGWIRYLDPDIRIDLVEGEYEALGHASRWLSASPDVRDAQGSEWQSERQWTTPGEFIELRPPQHLIEYARVAHGLILTDTREAVTVMAKLVLAARYADGVLTRHA